MDGVNFQFPLPQSTNLLNQGTWDSVKEELFFFSNSFPASTAWPTANLAIAVPFYVYVAGYVQQLWWVNGAAVSGHVQIGITDEYGNVIAQSPSTVPSGTNAPQAFSLPSPVLLVPGRYYIVLAADNNTQTFFAWAAAAAVTNINRLLGCFEQATAFPLPAALVPASSARSYIPLCGVSFGTQTL